MKAERIIVTILLTLGLQNLSIGHKVKKSHAEYDSTEVDLSKIRVTETHRVLDLYDVSLLRLDSEKPNLGNFVLNLFSSSFGGREYRSYFFVKISHADGREKLPSSSTVDILEFKFHDGLGGRKKYSLVDPCFGNYLYFGENYSIMYVGSPKLRDLNYFAVDLDRFSKL